MNVLEMKKKAQEYVNNNFKFTKIILLITSIIILVQLISGYNPIISIIINLIIIAINQGIAHSSLKIINKDKLKIIDDGLIGLKKIDKYFIIYFLYNILKIIPIIVITILYAWIFIPHLLTAFTIDKLVTNSTMILFIINIIVIIYISCCLAMFPYLLSVSKENKLGVLKESNDLMKGFKWDYIKLYLGFYKEYILILVIATMLMFIYPNYLVISVVTAILYVLLIQTRLSICKALFFNKIYQ